ncbi:MAG: hypothetical protein EOO41_05600 [Methanobacteriota archaeon]|nr:MAG: hypothetical protein EOO41_05600 [Euryarchaeota archaeon]
MRPLTVEDRMRGAAKCMSQPAVRYVGLGLLLVLGLCYCAACARLLFSPPAYAAHSRTAAPLTGDTVAAFPFPGTGVGNGMRVLDQQSLAAAALPALRGGVQGQPHSSSTLPASVLPASGEQAQAEAQHRAVREQLGRGTWNMLHRATVQFPKTPTDADKADVVSFFRTFAKFYPCEECAAHFRAMLDESPPDHRSNKHLAVWLCGLHNRVNVRLGKAEFSCTPEALKEAYGECGCFDDPASKDVGTSAQNSGNQSIDFA